MRERERGERKTKNWAPSLSGSQSKPVGLGKKTKQRVRASDSLMERERDSEVSRQQSGETGFTLKSRVSVPMILVRAVSGGLKPEPRSLPRNWTWVRVGSLDENQES